MICVAILLGMTSGCAIIPTIYSAVETISKITTGKGATNNILSEITGEDCVIHRKFVKGENNCEPTEEEPEE